MKKKQMIQGGPGENKITGQLLDSDDLKRERRKMERMRKEPMKLSQKTGKLAGITVKKS